MKRMTLLVAMLAGNILGMDGVDLIKSFNLFDAIIVTSTNLTFKLDSHPDISLWGFQFLGKERQGYRRLVPNEELVLVPNQVVHIESRSYRLILTPVSFQNQSMGFRATQWRIGSGSPKPTPTVAYIALNNIPMNVGEDDVEMTMDNGEWVKPKDSKRLEIEKLGWDAEKMIQHTESTMQNPERMAELFRNRGASNLWSILVEKGFIKQGTNSNADETVIKQTIATEMSVSGADISQDDIASVGCDDLGAPSNNTVPPSSLDELPPIVIARSGATKQSILLMGIGIFACLLAVLYFFRKKTTRNHP